MDLMSIFYFHLSVFLPPSQQHTCFLISSHIAVIANHCIKTVLPRTHRQSFQSIIRCRHRILNFPYIVAWLKKGQWGRFVIAQIRRESRGLSIRDDNTASRRIKGWSSRHRNGKLAARAVNLANSRSASENVLLRVGRQS